MKKIFFWVIVFLLFLSWPALIYAKSAGNIYVPSGVEIQGNYYGVGNTVEIAGAVESDLIVTGGNVVVKGAVGGDVIIAGGNLRIIGPVGGNVRAIAGNIDIFGTVARNITVAGGSVVIAESAQVAGHITAMAGSIEIRGQVQGGVLAGAGAVILAGEIQGPVKFYLDKGGSLDIRETAVTGASFDYYGLKLANIADGAQLSQAPLFHEFIRQPVKKIWWWRYLISLFGALVLGMVLVRLAPRKLQEVMDEMSVRPWVNLAWGTLWALLIPVIVIFLLLTIIGLPLALILAAVYVGGLILAPVIAGAALGWYIKSRLTNSWFGQRSLMVVILLGVIIYRSIVFIPVVGSLIGLVGALWAWGAILRLQKKSLESFR